MSASEQHPLIDAEWEITTVDKPVNNVLSRRHHPAQSRVVSLQRERQRAELAAAAVPFVSKPIPFPNPHAPIGFDLWLPRYEELNVHIIESEWPRNKPNDHIAIRCYDAEPNAWTPDYRAAIHSAARKEGWRTFYAWLLTVAPGQPELIFELDWAELTQLVKKHVKDPYKGKGGRTRAMELARKYL